MDRRTYSYRYRRLSKYLSFHIEMEYIKPSVESKIAIWAFWMYLFKILPPGGSLRGLFLSSSKQKHEKSQVEIAWVTFEILPSFLRRKLYLGTTWRN